MEKLAARGQLVAWQHEGFWHAMDTLRDRQQLARLWESGNRALEGVGKLKFTSQSTRNVSGLVDAAREKHQPVPRVRRRREPTEQVPQRRRRQRSLCWRHGRQESCRYCINNSPHKHGRHCILPPPLPEFTRQKPTVHVGNLKKVVTKIKAHPAAGCRDWTVQRDRNCQRRQDNSKCDHVLNRRQFRPATCDLQKIRRRHECIQQRSYRYQTE